MARTSADSTLITYTCCHYTITPRPVNSSPHDLYNIPTNRRRSSRHHCLDCGSNEISLQELRIRFKAALHDIRQFFVSAKIEYLTLGLRYFNITSKARSSASSSNLAQYQYGIEVRRWNVDPFFEPWIHAQQIAVHAGFALEYKTFDAVTASRICEEVNKARAIVGGIVGAVSRLKEGVEQILENERMQAFGRSIKRHAQIWALEREESALGDFEREVMRMQRRKRTKQALREEERRAMLKMAIRQAMFVNWQRRIEGFEEME